MVEEQTLSRDTMPISLPVGTLGIVPEIGQPLLICFLYLWGPEVRLGTVKRPSKAFDSPQREGSTILLTPVVLCLEFEFSALQEKHLKVSSPLVSEFFPSDSC